MNNFKTLFIIQLKEKLDLSFLKSAKQALFKVVFSILGFALVTVVAYLLLWLCQFLNLFSAINHVPLSFITLIFTIIMFINIITCTIGLSKTLYYSNDNQFLVTLPVDPNALFLSKMLVYYINEVKKSFILLIPIFLAYGILSSVSPIYYLWMPIMMIIITAVPVLIGGLLSIPMNYIMWFLNKYPIVKIVLFVTLFVAIFVGIFILINGLPSAKGQEIYSGIPKEINLIKAWSSVSQFIRQFLSKFTDAFMPFYAVCIFLCGRYENMKTTMFTEYSWIVLLILIAVIALFAGLNILASRPLYLHMITKQFEFNKDEKIHERKNKAHNGVLSACIYESKRCIRDTSRFSMTMGVLLIGTIAMLLLNVLYSAIATRTAGDYLKMAFNVLIIMLFVLVHNINVASIYSQDGDALVLNKNKPQKPWKILFPRLTYNMISSTIILITLSSMFYSAKACTLSSGECALSFFMMLFITYAHILWSADIDFMHPQANIFKTEGLAGVNPNEVKSAVLTFALAAASFGLVYFFLSDGGRYVWLKLFFIALLLLGLRIYLFSRKAKVLFREM